MSWLYLLLAIGAAAVAFQTSSTMLMAVMLLLALVLVIAWLMTALAKRIESRSGNEAMMVDPAELRRLQEQAEARRASASVTVPPTDAAAP